jgi:hypothetical protein
MTMIQHTSVEIIATTYHSPVMELALMDGCLVIMTTMANSMVTTMAMSRS